MLIFLRATYREPPLKLSTQDSPQTAKSEPSGHGPVSAGSETLALMVHSRILTDIIEGRLKPGRKLNTRLLVESYGAGNSPVREALSQLAGEGLVVRQERTGFRVAPTSAEELLEIVTTRCSLEETALRESIEHGGARWGGVGLSWLTIDSHERLVLRVSRCWMIGLNGRMTIASFTWRSSPPANLASF